VNPEPANARTLKFRNCEPDELRSVINGADLEHTILTPGACAADLRQFHHGDFSVDSGYYDFPVFVRGRFAPGRLCIGMSWGRAVPTWVNGTHLPRASIQIYAEDAEMLYRAGPATDWAGITVTRERLQAKAIQQCGRELSLPSQGMWQLPVPQVFAERLMRQAVKAGCATFDALDGIDPTGDRLLHTCVETILSADPSEARKIQQRLRHRFALIRRADTAIRQMVGGKYSSERLCRAIGVSERNLQIQFKEALGISPNTWHQRLALNRIRTRLLQGASRPGEVARLALDHGFDHLGRFSQDYRKLFGEPPSQTLRRSRAEVGRAH
jgi:AraC family ethanolamine operon transcriptional activator